MHDEQLMMRQKSHHVSLEWEDVHVLYTHTLSLCARVHVNK